MQPVTIKNNQFTHTLWLSQVILTLLVLLVFSLAFQVNEWVLALLPLLLFAIWKNQQVIKRQNSLQFKLNVTGQMTLHTCSPITDIWADDIKLSGFWQLPHALVIKLTNNENNQNIHMTVFRSVIGKTPFSNLLAGLNQACLKQN